MEKRIAYLGPVGTFTYIAATTLFSSEKNVQLIPFPTIPDCLQAVEEKETDWAVVPVENAIEGSVNSTIDWIIHHVDLPIRAELVYPITQCIMGHTSQEGRPGHEIERIYSHPQGIAQCQLTLRKMFPYAEHKMTESTAQAAELVANHPEQPWLAVGPKAAAERYELSIIKEHAEDHNNNFSRFFAVSREERLSADSASYKTSLQVTLPSDYPGALYQVLAAFSWRKVNLTHIESRPTKTGLGNYFFWIDAQLPVEHVLMQGAIEEIEALGCQVRVLGSFPCYFKKIGETLVANEKV
ncbi:prephenate dehydratase [Thermoactinomyces mirandus]|uniref:Prephenate dehydratase n=1 Tax=Thermoactinomyces mirandus TaxID=2756294 RepID=A0A7W2AR87_9BACL|nr:prephenate dehydratase [Thermoactinomyces mirandus]MBA4602734.1 prephenate dehydratase [Thermoactinomyces mirandus]